MKKVDYIEPCRFERLRFGDCVANAKALLLNELNIYAYGETIEVISKDKKKVVFGYNRNGVTMKITIYRNISKNILEY